LLRGVYFERWRPAHAEQHWTAERFLSRVGEAFADDPLCVAERGVSAVFALLSGKISTGEIEDVLACLPQQIHDLWIGSIVVASDEEC
jgi:uncharacterized protein (DUF2267 family)